MLHITIFEKREAGPVYRPTAPSCITVTLAPIPRSIAGGPTSTESGWFRKETVPTASLII